MTYVLGNGITAVFTPSTGTALTFAVTGFSWAGGDRPEIDVTTGGSARRQVLVGLASPEEYTLSVKYDGEALSAQMILCASGLLTVSMSPANDCAVPAAFIDGLAVDLVSFNHSVELDGILEGDVTFRRRH
tara:strand:- start:3299 stop:3691 length:393 start_codon:yes stop_codon:yes gene_type:complete